MVQIMFIERTLLHLLTFQTPIKKIEIILYVKFKLYKLKYNKMEHITFLEKRIGVDLGYHESNLHPANDEGRVGKSGLDKSLSLEEILEIAYKMNEKPNVIIKAGPRAKWYLKRCHKDLIETEIEKQRSWRDISRSTMWIIDWDT
jgi:hypothetical protein